MDLISINVSRREVDLESIFSSGQNKKRGIINISHQEAAKIKDILFDEMISIVESELK